MVVLQQVSCGVIQLSYGNLKIYLRLNEIQLRLSELSLGIENEEDWLGAQFVFPFIGMEAFPGKVHSNFGRFHGEFGLLECVYRVCNLQRDALIGAPLLVLIAAVADKGIGKIGFCAVILNGESQRKSSAVSRVGKMKSLAEAIAKAGRINQLGRNGSIELVAGDAVPGVKAREFKVRFKAVVSETNAQLITGQLLTRGFKLGTVGESAGERTSNVRVSQIAEGFGLVNKFEVADTGSRIQVGADDLAKLIFGLFERVFRPDNPDAARSDLGFRAVNIEWRESAEAQRLLIMVVAPLCFFEGLALHNEGFAGKDDTPIISDGSQDDVIHFALKKSTSLFQISLRDQNGRAIREQAELS